MLSYATVMICTLIFGRLFTYQRKGARFRFMVSAAATGLMMCCGITVIYIVSGRLVVSWYFWPIVAMLGLFALIIFHCKGNLAAVLEYSRAWNGSERRHH